LPSRLDKPLRAWTVADVLALVEERIEEGQRLEYKRELRLDTRGDRIEAAKDASGLANAVGGLLIYGVAEEETADGRRLPARTAPINEGDAQARLEDVLHSAVFPPLNFAAVTLAASEGGFYLVVRVMQRSGPLHMVEGYGQNRYFLRAGLATRPMIAHEVERTFRELGRSEAEALEEMSALPLVARIADHRSRNQDRESDSEPGIEPWVAIVCAPLDHSGQLLPMRPAEYLDFPASGIDGLLGDWTRIRPGGFLIDALGYVDQQPEDGELRIRTRLFRQGIFEWGRRYSSRSVPSSAFVEDAHDALTYFGRVYAEVGYYGRLRIWLRLENADRTTLGVPSAMWAIDVRGPQEPELEALSFETTANVETLLAGSLPIVHEAMDYIWQAFGYTRCLLFEDDRLMDRWRSNRA
jgi:hypothetical protein